MVLFLTFTIMSTTQQMDPESHTMKEWEKMKADPEYPVVIEWVKNGEDMDRILWWAFIKGVEAGKSDKSILSEDAKKYYARYRNNLKEWAEDDDSLREAAKKVFPEGFVEGDSYGVPPMMYLVDCLVCRILQLEGKERPKNWDTDSAWNDVKRLFNND